MTRQTWHAPDAAFLSVCDHAGCASLPRFQRVQRRRHVLGQSIVVGGRRRRNDGESGELVDELARELDKLVRIARRRVVRFSCGRTPPRRLRRRHRFSLTLHTFFYFAVQKQKMSPRRVRNPKTGNMVLASSNLGKSILRKRNEKRRRSARRPTRSGKKMRPLRRSPSRPTKSNVCSRRKSARRCGSNPNCKWRPKSKTCVRHNYVRSGRAVHQGPMMPGA